MNGLHAQHAVVMETGFTDQNKLPPGFLIGKQPAINDTKHLLYALVCIKFTLW